MNFELAYISVTLKRVAASMPNEAKRWVRQCFEHWSGQCDRIGKEEPTRVAFTLHEVIDEEMQRMLATSKYGPEVKCRKGCAACCHLHIDVFPQEAALLLKFAQSKGITIDKERLARQATKDQSTWHELAPEDRRCVFLGEDRACRVYQHRPGACRKYAVKTDPQLCDMEKHPGGKVGVVFSIEAEIVHSAAMTTYGANNMAAMLLKQRKTTP